MRTLQREKANELVDLSQVWWLSRPRGRECHPHGASIPGSMPGSVFKARTAEYRLQVRMCHPKSYFCEGSLDQGLDKYGSNTRAWSWTQYRDKTRILAYDNTHPAGAEGGQAGLHNLKAAAGGQLQGSGGSTGVVEARRVGSAYGFWHYRNAWIDGSPRPLVK